MLNKKPSENAGDIAENCSRDAIKENVTRVKYLRKQLEEWREVLAPLHGLLVWREDYYPGLLSAIVTLLFFLVWYWDPPALGLLAVIGMVVSAADYLVPAVCQSVFRQEDWSAAKEREYERMCQLIADMMCTVEQSFDSLAEWRRDKPKLHALAKAVGLFILGWIGYNLNNLFIVYLVVLFMVLYPGMKQRGLIKKYMAQSVLFVTNKIRPQRSQSADASRAKSE